MAFGAFVRSLLGVMVWTMVSLGNWGIGWEFVSKGGTFYCWTWIAMTGVGLICPNPVEISKEHVQIYRSWRQHSRPTLLSVYVNKFGYFCSINFQSHKYPSFRTVELAHTVLRNWDSPLTNMHPNKTFHCFPCCPCLCKTEMPQFCLSKCPN